MRKLQSCLVAVVTLGALVACGESDAEREQAETAAASEAEAEAAEEAAQRAEGKTEWRKCVNDTRGLLRTLVEIDSRFDVGMNYEELGNRLGDVSVAYNSMNFKRMEAKCIASAGVALENAFNQYNKSLGKWQACIQDYGCDVEGAKLAELQGHWSEASKRISKARRALASAKRYAKVDF